MTGSSEQPDPRRSAMVERQLRRRGIRDERVLEAMERIPRELFVPPELTAHAYDDAALPIGHGQTISQPFVVATMLELLHPEPGDRALDVGAGSGYNAALLAALGAEVVAVELVAELAERARAALSGAALDVDLRTGDGRRGAPDRAPFDVIAVAAASPDVPEALVEQLGLGGRLVLPLGDDWGQMLTLLERTTDGLRERRSLACRFVPLLVPAR